jgi:PAT family beta-lactamase induction signal transducer AmpG
MVFCLITFIVTAFVQIDANFGKKEDAIDESGNYEEE